MDDFYKNQTLNPETIACFLDNKCIHKNLFTGLFIIVYIIEASLLILDIFLIVLNTKEENTSQIKELDTQEKEFKVFLKGFLSDEK